jgi:putative Ig domain-containing protein
VSAVLIMGVAALAFAFASRASPAPPHVTVIGDSVLTAVEWNTAPRGALEHGFDVDMEVGVCRRIAAESCPYEGGRVPTVMDVIAGLGVRLGPTVLVEVGYNDDPRTFESDVEAAVQAMLRLGVQRVLWANFPASSQRWSDMNAALDVVAERHREVTIIDWDHASHERWSWFQGDGIHLLYEGAMAMATLFNDALVQLTAPPTPPPPPPRAAGTQLPPARVGQLYSANLAAESGTAPYRWRSVGGPLPRGLHLLANGSITGVPRRPGRTLLVFQVIDARGATAVVRDPMVVLGNARQTTQTAGDKADATPDSRR